MSIEKLINKYPSIRNNKIYAWIRNLYHKKNNAYMEKRIKSTNMYGYHVINEFMNLAEKLNICIWLDWGTLLGYHREGSLIGYDYDVDFATWALSNYEHEQLIHELEGLGYYRIRYTKTKNFYIEETYVKDGCHADINYYYGDNNLAWTYVAYKNEKTKVRYKKGIQFKHGLVVCRFETCNLFMKTGSFFNGTRCCIPRDTERRVVEEYGENWRIPNKDYNWLNESNYVYEGFCEDAMNMNMKNL